MLTYPLVTYFWSRGKRNRNTGVWFRNSGVSAMHLGYYGTGLRVKS
jgi:hypothetical protein